MDLLFFRDDFATADENTPTPDLNFGRGDPEIVSSIRRIRKMTWLSQVQGARWSGTDDELTEAYTNVRNKLSKGKSRRGYDSKPWKEGAHQLQHVDDCAPLTVLTHANLAVSALGPPTSCWPPCAHEGA